MTEAILLFVKYPEKGRVKTRLAADFKGDVVELYKCFVLDLLDMLSRIGAVTFVCFYPSDVVTRFKAWIGDRSFIPQVGADLGERLKNCFLRAFESCNKVVVIGSDSPDLPEGLIGDAFAELDSHDAVIGPAADGGYYLIGFRKGSFLPDVFEGMQWSTDSVFADTMKRFKNANCDVAVLPEWSDVDTFKDLRDLVERNEHSGFKYSRTMNFIAKFAELCGGV